MNKFLIAAAVAFAGVAIALAPGQRPKYEMLNCPVGLYGYDENFKPNCQNPSQACVSGVCTGTAPTTDGTQGMSLFQLKGWTLSACAPQYTLYADGGIVRYTDAGLDTSKAETFTGAGEFDVYGWNDARSRWQQDQQLTQYADAGAGLTCVTFQDFFLSSMFGRVRVVPNGVGMHFAGSNFTDAGVETFLNGQIANQGTY